MLAGLMLGGQFMALLTRSLLNVAAALRAGRICMRRAARKLVVGGYIRRLYAMC